MNTEIYVLKNPSVEPLFGISELANTIISQALEIRRAFPPSIDKRLHEYTQKILSDAMLSDQEKYAIFSAMYFSIYAHKSQTRKKKINGEHPPYIEHPLSMAERAWEEGLNDPLLHMIIWLHDAAEDAPKTYSGTTPEEWLKKVFTFLNGIPLIRDWLNGYTEISHITSYSYTRREVLRDALLVLTKQLQNIEEYPHFALKKITKAYVQRGGVHKPKDKGDPKLPSEIESKIRDTYSLLRGIIKMSSKSPDHLRILVVKVLDIWHNLEDPDLVSEIKRLRSIVGINIAYLLGWYSITREITTKSISIINLRHPLAPKIPELQAQESREEFLREFNNMANEAINYLGLKLPYSEREFPFINVDVVCRPFWDNISDLPALWFSKDINGENVYIPKPELVVGIRYPFNLTQEKILKIAAELRVSTNQGYAEQNMLLYPWLLREMFLSRHIRLTNVPPIGTIISQGISKHHKGFVLTLRDSTQIPIMPIDLFKKSTISDPVWIAGEFLTAPNITLFLNPFLGNNQEELTNMHATFFTDFLYHPNGSIMLGERRVVVLYQGKVFFLDAGNILLKELIQALNPFGREDYFLRTPELRRFCDKPLEALIRSFDPELFKRQLFLLRTVRLENIWQ